jgi:hypothetical protein
MSEQTPEEQSENQSKPKRGRPKGAKTRPKWMRDALKKAPKRPVGRPKGSQTKPKTLEELVEKSLTYKPAPRPKRPKKVLNHESHFERLKREDPEKLKAISNDAAAKAAKVKRKVAGIPTGVTHVEWAVMLDEAQKLAKRILREMDNEGALPENPLARTAMQEAVTMLATDLPAKDKLAVIRTILEWNLAKPAATNNVNLKTAEDFLDELAAKE